MSKVICIPGFAPVRLGATDLTRLADVIVPEVFAGYVQTLTQEKSRLIQSSALVVDPRLSNVLASGGLTFNEPFYHDLLSDDDHGENISTDKGPDSTPDNIQAATEIQIRLSRNKSWGSADLVAALAGNDPMDAIANRVAAWRVRRLQQTWLAMMKGVFATNNSAPANGSTHTQGDLTLDISTTESSDFSSSAFISATGLLGDSMDQLTMVMMHSMLYQSLQRANLIDFIPDARGEVNIATYQGREVIVDDSMPFDTGIAEMFLLGEGATALGVGSPKTPVAITRSEAANMGGGEETLFNRWEWIIHPVGHAWKGTSSSKGGPSNIELAANGSFIRVFRERKAIRIARLICHI